MTETETLEEMQARHRREVKDLQARITNKKKNATKKTRKGVNDECAQLERELRERQEGEIAALSGSSGGENIEGEEEDVDGVVGRLEETTISDPSPLPLATEQLPPPQSTQTQTEEQEQTQAQQQGGGNNNKKRNRQKERMARRAAEQEAAAARAEQEALSMPDRRGVERSALERVFAAHALREKEIRPDGHCLFSAVADQLGQVNVPIYNHNHAKRKEEEKGGEGGQGEEEEEQYKTIRKTATDYISAHADDFAPFLEEPLDTYVAKMRDTAEWGGQLELLALASAYHVVIKVVQDGRVETIRPQNNNGGGGAGDEKEKTIWLAYYRHGYGLGEHYNSLRVKG
ncbi:OTU domain-containing protein 6B [Xylariaceae sp. FL0594]|nr:OTU domain-containing protein 6B [Xylariaceae sp. FL0594]